MHILSNCSYHLHQLGTCKSHRYSQGMILKSVLPLGWVISMQFTRGLFALHCVSAWGPLSAQPQLGFKQQNPWTKWRDHAMIWMSSYGVFCKDSQDKLRTAYSMFLVGWTLDEWWSAMVIMKKSPQLFVTHASWKWPTCSITFTLQTIRTIRRPCQKRRNTYWETGSSKVLIEAVLPFNSLEMSSCDPVNPVCRFNFFTS